MSKSNNECGCDDLKFQMNNLVIDHLKTELDQLWSNNYWMTREIIRDIFFNNVFQHKDIENLYQNQDQLGINFSKLVHDDKSGEKLSLALKEHIKIIIDIISSTINKKSIKIYLKQLRKNVHVIAEIYFEFNNKISIEKLSGLFDEYLDELLLEILAIINNDCSKNSLEQVHSLSEYINSKFY